MRENESFFILYKYAELGFEENIGNLIIDPRRFFYRRERRTTQRLRRVASALAERNSLRVSAFSAVCFSSEEPAQNPGAKFFTLVHFRYYSTSARIMA